MKSKNTLRIKLYALIIALVVILAVVALSVSSVFYSATLENRYKGTCKSVCETTEGLLRNHDFKKYVEGENRVEYVAFLDQIRDLKNAVSDVDCIAVYHMEEDGMRILIDASSKVSVNDLGVVKNYDNTWNKYKSDFLAGKKIENAEILLNSGMSNMYCMPVEHVGGYDRIYVCAGVQKSLVENDKAQFMTSNRNIVVSLAFIVLLVALFFVERRVISPIKKISSLVDEAVERKDVGFVQELADKKIETKNELDNLYQSIIKIYTSKARLESAAEKANPEDSDSILSLIKRMDRFSAAHLDNSLQYVILIMEKMRSSEKYKDILTDELYENILLAAPLHDVGKLAIPEDIVNKPEKLNDEEYAKMKEHSRLGAKIIDELYLKYSDDEYLYLAREIALSHHERWDGTGYPNGKKGEEIPLAVRIVSIADVFDALISERIYKPPYSFEESIDIIASYRGTFFDPDLTDIFVSSKDDAYKVYKGINNEN